MFFGSLESGFHPEPLDSLHLLDPSGTCIGSCTETVPLKRSLWGKVAGSKGSTCRMDGLICFNKLKMTSNLKLFVVPLVPEFRGPSSIDQATVERNRQLALARRGDLVA